MWPGSRFRQRPQATTLVSATDQSAQGSIPSAESTLPGREPNTRPQRIESPESRGELAGPAEDDRRVHDQATAMYQARQRRRLNKQLVDPVENAIQHRARLPLSTRPAKMGGCDPGILEELPRNAQAIEAHGRIFGIAQLLQDAKPGAERVRGATASVYVLAGKLNHIEADRRRRELSLNQ